MRTRDRLLCSAASQANAAQRSAGSHTPASLHPPLRSRYKPSMRQTEQGTDALPTARDGQCDDKQVPPRPKRERAKLLLVGYSRIPWGLLFWPHKMLWAAQKPTPGPWAHQGFPWCLFCVPGATTACSGPPARVEAWVASAMCPGDSCSCTPQVLALSAHNSRKWARGALGPVLPPWGTAAS